MTADAENQSLTDAIAAAWPEDEPEPTPEPAEESVPEPEPEAQEEAETPAEEPAEEAPEVALKAPAGWTPAQKERWKDLTPELQQTILDRDRQVDSTLQEAASDRKIAASYKEMVQSYAPVFAAEGVEPMQGIQGLINITAELQNGSPAMKAQRIAGLVKHYGVDINALDQALAGEQPQDSQMFHVEQMINQRLAPIQQMFQQSQQQTYSQADQSIEAFAADPNNEFFLHVKNDMADFMDMASARGQNMSLEEAYQRACAMNPEIQGVLEQRKANEALVAQQADIQKKKAAASSIAGRQAGTQVKEGMSMRDTIAAAMDGETL